MIDVGGPSNVACADNITLCWLALANHRHYSMLADLANHGQHYSMLAGLANHRQHYSMLAGLANHWAVLSAMQDNHNIQM